MGQRNFNKFLVHKRAACSPQPASHTTKVIRSMRQTRFRRSAVVKRINHAKRRLRIMLAEGMEEEGMILCYQRLRAAQKDLDKINLRAQEISFTNFNLNVFCEEECYRMFRFRSKDIGKVVELCGWLGGRTKRSGYVVDSITAVCVMLRKLSFPTRWKEIERLFGMRSSAMSEIFYEVMESLVRERGNLLENFRAEMMEERAEMYAKAIHEQGAPLSNCVGFSDCTKIAMCRPGGRGSLQRTVYSGHKRFHCLIYQTITTPDGLLFYLMAPKWEDGTI